MFMLLILVFPVLFRNRFVLTVVSRFLMGILAFFRQKIRLELIQCPTAVANNLGDSDGYSKMRACNYVEFG